MATVTKQPNKVKETDTGTFRSVINNKQKTLGNNKQKVLDKLGIKQTQVKFNKIINRETLV